MRTDWVQNDIPTHFEQVALFLNQNGSVPSLEEMAYPPMPFIECLGVDAVQLPHAN
jgi:hypothetical protein